MCEKIQNVFLVNTCRVVVVVMTVKKHSKQHFVYTHSSVGVGSLSTSPSNQDTLQESALEKEAEKFKEAIEERRNAEHKDKDSLEASQDHAEDETGM